MVAVLQTDATNAWPSGTTECAALIRSGDWAATQLGASEQWSAALRSTTELVLACSFPMILLWGPELIQIYNDGYAVIMGEKHPKGMGQPTRECWPEVWQFNEPVYDRVLQGETLTFENQLFPIHRYGFLEQAYFTLCYSPLRAGDASSDIFGILVTVFETTLQIQAVAAQARIQQELQNLIDSTPQISWSADALGESVTFGRQWTELTGLSAAESQEHERYAIVHPEDRAALRSAWQSSVQSGEPFDLEYRLSVDGNYRWVRSRARARLDEAGAIARWYGTSEDIHERRVAQDRLRILAERLAVAQQAGQMASWQWDFETGTMTWDNGSEWTWGRPAASMALPETVFSFVYDDDREKVRRDLIPVMEDRGEYRSEFRVVWPDGSTHWLLAFGKTVHTLDGKPYGIVGINIDLTERKLAEAALMQTEKLAAVGRLASTMAHEINNPLEAVTNLLYLARNSADLAEALPFLQTADAELRRAGLITNQALRFHKQATRPTQCTFEHLTQGLFDGRHSRLLNAEATESVRDRTTRPVLLFDGEVRQVLNNLVGNAIDALTGTGGKLFVRGRDGKDWATGRPGMVITVADTGSGMSPLTRKKLFDAFFTTKGVGGTGLGLWVSREIIERHAGSIHLRSSQAPQHHGTVFTLFFPYEAAVRTLAEL